MKIKRILVCFTFIMILCIMFASCGDGDSSTSSLQSDTSTVSQADSGVQIILGDGKSEPDSNATYPPPVQVEIP